MTESVLDSFAILNAIIYNTNVNGLIVNQFESLAEY